MANIWRIYRRDWLNLFKAPVALLLVCALIVLPSVYDWVNVAAVWDPYSNTSGIRIAVVNLDEGTSVEGQQFNIGGQVLDSLRGNRTLGWIFTDEKTARSGVRRGDYYASIVIPADFSRKLGGLLEGRLDKPQLIYTVNEKINAIAPKITAKGASTITAQIGEHFTQEISSTVLTALRGIDREFQAELPVIRRVEQGLFTLEAHLPELEEAGRLVLKLERQWPEIAAQAQTLTALTDRLPALERAGQAAQALDADWPQLSAAAERLRPLQAQLPGLMQAAQQTAALAGQFGRVDELLEAASARLAEAETAVAAAADRLPDAAQFTAAAELERQLQQYLAANGDAFAAVPAVLQQNLLLLQQTGHAAVLLAGRLEGGAEPAAPQLRSASAELAAGSAALGDAAALLAAVHALAPDAVSGAELQGLRAAQQRYGAGAEQAGRLAAGLEKGGEPAAAQLAQFSETAQQGLEALERFAAGYSGKTQPALRQSLSRLTASAADASGTLANVPQQLEALSSLLAEAQEAIAFGGTRLAALREELPAVRSGLQAAADGTAERLAALSGLFTETLPRIESGLPAAGAAVHRAAEFARTDLPAAEERLREAAQLVEGGLPQAGRGVSRAAGLVRSDLPALEAAIQKAAATVRSVKEDVNLDELAQLLGGDIKTTSDFLASPVELKEHALYPIPNYGSAMTPFYVVLSLWVGGTLLVSLLRTTVEDTGGMAYSSRQKYFGRLLTFMTIGVLQALVAGLGNLFLLGGYAANRAGFVLAALLISLVFVTIIYSLVAVFGNIGKGIAIIFMVLQFSSSGGTFPVSTTGHWFQLLHPFMPFTYAISLMRETVGGVVPEVAIRDVLLLLLSGLLAMLLALTLQKPLEPFIRKAAERAEKSRLIS
ncbi:YhgE/Pip domain-containing protein [Paenibacillus tepidiphilus]|uniref:YhgE/Pip domain-containing protein n=1 Tax=Paenibacillus tepidiphilus TaxID=2608683 RepID=UPI0012384959|nr:YhgE/Pip domain-containing protein [Paenibacillus tepidiphilus]